MGKSRRGWGGGGERLGGRRSGSRRGWGGGGERLGGRRSGSRRGGEEEEKG